MADPPPPPGGDSHIKRTGVLVGNRRRKRSCFVGVAGILFNPLEVPILNLYIKLSLFLLAVNQLIIKYHKSHLFRFNILKGTSKAPVLWTF